jgi:hypothetical protein
VRFGAILPQIGWGPDNPFTLDPVEQLQRFASAVL